LSPVTVNAAAASVGRADAVVAAGAVEAIAVVEAAGAAGTEGVIGAGPVAGGVAEHETESAAIAHTATTTATVRATGVI
jgi:hypothetical protein